MAKKILIASTNPWSFCMAVEQNIAVSNRYDHVDVIDLFRLCSSVSPHWRQLDVHIERVNRKIPRFVVKAANGVEITPKIGWNSATIPTVLNEYNDIRGYSVGAAKIGLATLSSVTSITTIQEPLSTSEYGGVLPAAWRSAHLSAQAGEAVKQLGYDEVYIFNGRLCYARPFCDVLETTSRVIRYEQGTGNSYIQADSPIHEPGTFAKLVKEHDFDRADGETFYNDRLQKAPGDPVNFFTASQVEGLLPNDLKSLSFVAFFTSSGDEFTAITDDVKLGSFVDQYAAVEAVARAASDQGKAFVLRLHPHLQYKHGSWERGWDFQKLEECGARIIAPEDSCDTYALAAAAHCVFTAGSTVGFECSYRGIANANIGKWIGPHLGAMHHVQDRKGIEEFIANPTLPLHARERALLYGSFLKRAGKPLSLLEVGSHPNYTRLGGKIVDPVRYITQTLRDAVLPPPPRRIVGIQAGMVTVDPYIEARANSRVTEV